MRIVKRTIACTVTVEVDGETGAVKVKRLVSVNDVGFAINPLNVGARSTGPS